MPPSMAAAALSNGEDAAIDLTIGNSRFADNVSHSVKPYDI